MQLQVPLQPRLLSLSVLWLLLKSAHDLHMQILSFAYTRLLRQYACSLGCSTCLQWVTRINWCACFCRWPLSAVAQEPDAIQC